MKLYFVRHGESEYNAKNIHQHKDVPLSQIGTQQVKTVAKRFAHLPVDLILASHYKRAQETADIINEVVQKKVIYINLLKELKRPTEIEGKPLQDQIAVQIKSMIRQNHNNPDWHYSDEENFYDLKKRAKEFIEKLSDLREDNILVVSHAVTIRVIIFSMILGDLLTPDIFDKLEHQFTLNNTGITICERDKTGMWKLVIWNDLAHLGE